MDPISPQQPGRSPTAAGFLVGFFVAALVVTLVGYGYVTKKSRDVRKGWNLVPVVVATMDLEEGTVITFEMLSQRQVPEQFVTSSVVKPDSASYILNQKVQVPIQAGDLLLWSQVETKKLPAMLFAARDVPSGVELSEADVEERGLPAQFVTGSFVGAKDRPHAVGRKLIAPFRRGDPILWTHFQADPGEVQPARGR